MTRPDNAQPRVSENASSQGQFTHDQRELITIERRARGLKRSRDDQKAVLGASTVEKLGNLMGILRLGKTPNRRPTTHYFSQHRYG